MACELDKFVLLAIKAFVFHYHPQNFVETSFIQAAISSLPLVVFGTRSTRRFFFGKGFNGDCRWFYLSTECPVFWLQEIDGFN